MSPIWAGVDRLVDAAPGLAELRLHRIELLAARRWRELGRPVPAELLEQEHWAGVVALATPLLLERARAACEGPLVLVKGAEVAARYPEPTLRPTRDIDLLVPDAEGVQRALLEAGFEPVGEEELYVDIHHLRPLSYPGLPLYLEIHSELKWPEGLDGPRTDELLADTAPASVGVDGILSLPPAHHSLVLAAHAWAHAPLAILSQLIDAAAMAEGVDRGELERLARRWGLRKVWRSTSAACDALLGEHDHEPWPLRVWARHLRDARQQTILEAHLARLLSPFAGLPGRPALRMASAAFLNELRRTPGEPWSTKLRRTSRALRNASVPQAEHDRELEREQLSAPTYLEQLRAHDSGKQVPP